MGESLHRLAAEGFLVGNLLLNVLCYTEESLSQPAVTAPLSGEPECKRASPERGGGPAKLVEGFCGIFCLMYEVTRKHPSVTCGDSSPKGEPKHQKGSLDIKSLPFRGGEPSQTVEGFFCEIFCFV